MKKAVGIAYLADGKLYLKKDGDTAPRLLESAFLEEAAQRAERNRQRNEWKSEGLSWNISRGGMAGRFGAAAAAPIDARTGRISSLAGSAGAHQLIYSIDMGAMGALFALDAEGFEQRLIHRNNLRLSGISKHQISGSIATAIRSADMSCHIAIGDADGRKLREVTEGDSIDEHPHWVADGGGVLVYQSAGIARDQNGLMCGLSEYAIHQLDLDSGEMTIVAEEPAFDLLLPHATSDGAIMYIRRPYEPVRIPSVWRALLDVVLFPFRLVVAIVHFLNFFSMVFARKPLITADGPPREPIQSRYMMLFGRIVDAEKELRKGRGQAVPLVPQNWELVRRSKDGIEEVLAKSVICYAVCGDDTYYSDGSRIFRIAADGSKSEVCTGTLIHSLVVVNASD